jgi:hypothetical protein
MQNVNELFDYDSLAFFGRVNASISHELKNIMAIISETAGLLGDLSEMASTEAPVDPDILKSSTDSIMEEIQRGFTTIRQMNRFSHSVDAPIVSIDLTQLLDLVGHLSTYLSFAGEIRLTPLDGDPPKVRTCPFILLAIVYEIAFQHFKNAGPDAVLEVTVRPTSASGWAIDFSGLSISEFHAFPDHWVKKAAASIAATIDWEKADHRLNLYVPSIMQAGAADADSVEPTDGGGKRSIPSKTT